MSEPGILPKPIAFGKYYLLERVNVGGMAEIFKAKAFGVEGFERLLAVKQILSSIAEDESFINMFIDEAKIAGQLNHPNVAQIFDLGKVDGSYFIALEYISGKDLKTSFERARRIGEKVSIPRVCYNISKVCEGLGYAHAKKDSQGRDLNIVHRDVSPQNILVSYEGEVKVIDFGIAKAQGKSSQTQVGILKGKFSYMSPEQVRGLHVDHRSDIFSLGIVLYELLTLERLFLGDSDFDTLEKIRKVEMSPPSLYNPHIPKELEDIVLKALARTPEERFQSAYDLSEALERFMRNQGYYYTNKDLASYMKEAFSADIEFENKKFEYYQSLNLKPLSDDPQPSSPSGQRQAVRSAPKGRGQLSWGEDEMETQIFDRAMGEDEEEEEIGESAIIYSQDVIGRNEEPPTREFDRWDVNLDLAHITFKDEPEAPAARRKPAPTAQLEAIERRNGAPVTAQVSVPPTMLRAQNAAGPKFGKIGLIAALVLVLGCIPMYLYATRERPAPLIVFETEPGAVKILLNDALIHDGPTPFEYKAVPGMARLVIRQDGFEPYESSVDLVGGKTYKLNQTLKRALNDTTGIKVQTTPAGARVEIAGVASQEQTPLTVRQLKAGKHSVKISLEGYFEEVREIEIEAEKIAEIEIALRPKKLALAINSNPDRSDFTVFEKDGDQRIASGKTPEVVRDLDATKAYKIVVERRGFDNWEHILEPGLEAAPTLSAEMARNRRDDFTQTERVIPPVVATTTTRTNLPKTQPKTEPKTEPTVRTTPTKTASADDDSGTAMLSIASRPVARVYINDKDTGRYTPLIDFKIKSGNHKIGLVNPDFGLNKTYFVELKGGESKRIINR
ncbi:MAG: serine/threonine protein kinase [Bradymonadaceae bacterium]|nr:serine/threonine protein kinase [Lujinxingiaceae bacterium]